MQYCRHIGNAQQHNNNNKLLLISIEACFEAARQSLSSSQILWQQQLGFSRPAAGWIQPAARDYISAAPTSPVASHFLLRPIRGDLRPIRGDLTNHRTFHQIVGTRKSWSSRRQQTKQHFLLFKSITLYPTYEGWGTPRISWHWSGQPQ